MTYYGAKQLAASFRTVRKNTIQIAEEIPESKFDFRAAPDTRTVAQTLTHIAATPRIQMHVHKNRIDDMSKVNFPALFQELSAEEAQPRTKAEIISLLKSSGEEFATFLDGLSEDFLAEQVSTPFADASSTGRRSRFEMLLAPKEHEMHHRGQLMVMQRMLGMVPHLTRQMQQRMAQRTAQAAAGQQAQ
jgi:uncharacterized damage-inducible protein DinB